MRAAQVIVSGCNLDSSMQHAMNVRFFSVRWQMGSGESSWWTNYQQCLCLKLFNPCKKEIYLLSKTLAKTFTFPTTPNLFYFFNPHFFVMFCLLFAKINEECHSSQIDNKKDKKLSVQNCCQILSFLFAISFSSFFFLFFIFSF